MLFCPTCSNMLLINSEETNLAFSCRICTQRYSINETFANRVDLKRKEVDDIMGGKDAWKDAALMDAECPTCKHSKAYYFELQTRSADEPMTIFYKCENCAFDWKEN